MHDSDLEKERLKLANANYFEGILQLRHPTDKLLEYTLKKVKSDKKAFITKQKKVPNGWDYYFSSQKYLQQVGRHLLKVFPGELKTARKIHSLNRITGKNIYRVTVLFRLLPFGKGQIIKMGDDELLVIRLAKDRAEVKNLKSGKKDWFDIKKLKCFI